MKKVEITMIEYYADGLRKRRVEKSTVHFSNRLLHQLIVDAYTLIEERRLNLIEDD